MLIQRLNLVIENSNLKIEIVLIDDGSYDQTKKLMSDLGLSNSNYTCVFYQKILDTKMLYLLVWK